MQLPTGNLDTIRDGIRGAVEQLTAADSGATATGTDSDPALLARAFEQLADVMERIEADLAASDAGQVPGASADISELGEYALKLNENLAGFAGDPVAREHGAGLVANLAVWIARHGGHIDTLEPVVDGFALLANRLSEPRDLEALAAVMGEVCAAVSPLIREDLERINPGRPWRILLLNRGIVATRSHNPAVMEAAFAYLTRHLPEDAARFFTEGMQQMDAVGYPAAVRQVMEKYHRQWTLNRSLH